MKRPNNQRDWNNNESHVAQKPKQPNNRRDWKAQEKEKSLIIDDLPDYEEQEEKKPPKEERIIKVDLDKWIQDPDGQILPKIQRVNFEPISGKEGRLNLQVVHSLLMTGRANTTFGTIPRDLTVSDFCKKSPINGKAIMLI